MYVCVFVHVYLGKIWIFNVFKWFNTWTNTSGIDVLLSVCVLYGKHTQTQAHI